MTFGVNSITEVDLSWKQVHPKESISAFLSLFCFKQNALYFKSKVLIIYLMEVPGFIELLKIKEMERISKASTWANTKKHDSSRAFPSQINEAK